MGRKYVSEKVKIPSSGGQMKMIILRPVRNKKKKEDTPAVLWIHGGGYAVGMSGMVYMSRAKDLVKKYGAVVISPEYRLAGKHPYPAALEDCISALVYIKENHGYLGISPDKIMAGGESAGGGLAVAVCMHERDRKGVNISFQMPLYPMLDNCDTPSSAENKGLTWNTKRNHAAWKMYLRDIKGDIPPYASPSRQTDYSNLPPCYTFVGNREAFYCESMEYVNNLKKAGVNAHMDVYDTGCHAFDMLLPFLKKSKKAAMEFERQFVFACENYTAGNFPESGNDPYAE